MPNPEMLFHKQNKNTEPIEPIGTEYQGQPDMTVSDLGHVARALLESSAWKKLFEGSSKRITPLVDYFNKLIKLMAQVYPKLGVTVPFFDPDIRKVTTKMFTSMPQMDSSEIYDTLGTGGIYGAVHRFQVQSLPEGLKVDFGTIFSNKYHSHFYEKLLHFVPGKFSNWLREILTVANQTMIEVDEKYLGKETKWRSNDKETRYRLIEEMFNHLKEVVKSEKDNNQRFVVLEPGGGNGEGSVLLAEKIADDPELSGRITILVREYGQGMISEGRTKVFLINSDREKNNKKPIDIEFIKGSAIVPVSSQLAKVKKLYHNNNIQELKEDYSLNSLEMTKELLDKVNGARIVGGMSFFTAGAMSTELGENSIAVKIAQQLREDVEEGGLILWNDFAAAPKTSYINRLSEETKNQVRRMKEIFDEFGKLGFQEELKQIYKFWGGAIKDNPGHDVRQIWEIMTAMETIDNKEESITETEVNLKPFAILPVYKVGGNKWICYAIPGYFELLVRTKGKGKNKLNLN